MPENPESYHPNTLLNQLRPGLTFKNIKIEATNEVKVFGEVDGIYFEGLGKIIIIFKISNICLNHELVLFNIYSI